MIVGTGHDIVDIRRIEALMTRFGDRFMTRCFSAEERDYARRRTGSAAQAAVLAKRFAAKEATAKAFGTGFSGGLLMQDIAVIRGDSGAPMLELSARAFEYARKAAGGKTPKLHLSLSDEYPYASAWVIIEA